MADFWLQSYEESAMYYSDVFRKVFLEQYAIYNPVYVLRKCKTMHMSHSGPSLTLLLYLDFPGYTNTVTISITIGTEGDP